MRGKASRFRREKRPTHLGRVVGARERKEFVAQRGINLLFILLFCPFCGSKRLKKDEKGLIQTKGQDAGIMYTCVLCIKISRNISLSLSFFHSLSRFLKSSLSLYFFTSFFISFSLSLALQCHLSFVLFLFTLAWLVFSLSFRSTFAPS